MLRDWYLSVLCVANHITKVLSYEDVLKGDRVKNLNKTYYRSASNGQFKEMACCFCVYFSYLILYLFFGFFFFKTPPPDFITFKPYTTWNGSNFDWDGTTMWFLFYEGTGCHMENGSRKDKSKIRDTTVYIQSIVIPLRLVIGEGYHNGQVLTLVFLHCFLESTETWKEGWLWLACNTSRTLCAYESPEDLVNMWILRKQIYGRAWDSALQTSLQVFLPPIQDKNSRFWVVR